MNAARDNGFPGSGQDPSSPLILIKVLYEASVVALKFLRKITHFHVILEKVPCKVSK